MRFVLALALLSASAVAQDNVALMSAEAACGPAKVSFSATADATQHPVPQPEPDRALVFVVEDLGQCSDCFHGRYIASDVSSAVVKIGVDGSWVGADRGNSYLFFSVTPGEHHMCMNWQSRLSIRSHAFAMANLTAEAGKVYYLRARVFPGENNFSFDLDRVDTDEGKFLVAASPYSVSHAKK
jgi:hypothetical protein